jgi:histidyl-tRNA synthetase
MFRSERPQKGRLRQFHQIGVEIIGSRSPQIDGEVIWRLNKLLRLFGLEGFLIKLNSLGCKADKARFSEKLKDYLKKEKNRLCDDCKVRIEKNALRVLDCKNETCGHVIKNAPDITDSLCQDCILHFSTVKAMLESEKINFERVKNLVRGLDYYTGTVFEVTHPALGGQDALAAGGRYDNLVKEMGGQDAGATGFAIGMERVMIALGDKKNAFAEPAVVYIATLGKDGKIKGLRLAEELKKELNKDNLKIITLIDFAESSLKSQMRSADKNGAKFVIIIGDDEVAKGEVTIRDMATKEQASVRFADAVKTVKEKL